MQTIRDLSDDDLRAMVEQGLPLADYVAEVERRTQRARHDALVRVMALETQNAILQARLSLRDDEIAQLRAKLAGAA